MNIVMLVKQVGRRKMLRIFHRPCLYRYNKSSTKPTPRPARRRRRRNPGEAGVWRAKLAAGRGVGSVLLNVGEHQVGGENAKHFQPPRLVKVKR
jgi:hypothetical protein